MIGDHPPEGAGVGGSHRLALVQHGGASVEQRPVDAHVRRRPVHLARAHVVHVLHRPLHGDGVAAVVADDPLRLAGRSRRVQDVERIGRCHRDAVVRDGGSHLLLPVEVAFGPELGGGHLPLIHHDVLGLMRGNVDGPLEQRLVFDDAVDLDAA